MKSAFLTADWQFHRPTEKEVTVDEVCWSERRLPRLRCRLLRCDLFWQPVTTEMLLWHMAMAESKWKSLPCLWTLFRWTCTGRLVRLYPKRSSHEKGWARGLTLPLTLQQQPYGSSMLTDCTWLKALPDLDYTKVADCWRCGLTNQPVSETNLANRVIAKIVQIQSNPSNLGTI